MCTFLTMWDPPTQGPRATKLPKQITSIFKISQEHNISFAPLKLSMYLKNQLPVWLHLSALPKTYHKMKDECLQTIHKAKSVKDLREIAARLTNDELHNTKASCAYTVCFENHQLGCKNRDKCARNMSSILENLLPKFNSNMSPKKKKISP